MAINFVNNPKVGDNVKIEVGDSSDLQIYHDATDSYITNSTGDLTISNTGDDLILKSADDFLLYVQGTELAIQAVGDGGVILRHNNVVKFETTSTGVTVTGEATIDSSNATLNIKGSNTGASLINFADAADGNVGRIYYDHTDNFMQFKVNDTEKVRINNSGFVGIGSTNPIAPLEVKSSETNHLTLYRPANTTEGNAGSMNFDGNDSDSNQQTYAKIESFTDDPTAGSHAGKIRFSIAKGADGITSAMTIQKDAQVSLNQYGQGSYTGTAAYTLQVDSAGNIIEGSTSGGGTVTGSGAATRVAFWSGTSALSSDANLYWDNSNDRLGIGTTSPANVLGINVPSGTTKGIYFQDSGTTNYGTILQYVEATNLFQIKQEENGVQTGILTIKRADGNVGIGTTSPTVKLAVEENVNLSASILVNNPNTGTGARANLILTSDSARIDMYATSAAYNGVTSWADAGVINTSSATSGGLILNAQSGGIKFQYATAEKMRITSSGELQLTQSNAEFDFTSSSSSGYKTTFNMDDTGLDIGHNSSSRALNLQTNSTDRLTITGAGNVGIGTTSPDGKLTISGGGSSTAPTISVINTSSTAFNHSINAFTPNLTSGESNILVFGRAGSTKNSAYIGYRYSGTAGSNDNLLILGHWASDNLMTISGDGKVGIGTGTTAADCKLRIDSNDNNQLKLNRQGVGAFKLFVESGGGFVFEDDGSERMRIDSAGSVGIGNSNPANKLSVNLTSSVALASQPAVPLFVGNNGNSVDGRVFIDVKHDAISTAGAIGAGLRMQAGAVTTGTASYNSSLIFLQSAGAGSNTIHSAPKAIQFYVDNHDTAAGSGSNYSQYGDLAMTIAENTSVGIGVTSPGTVNDTAFGGVMLHVKGPSNIGRLVLEGAVQGTMLMNATGSTENKRLKFIQSKQNEFRMGKVSDSGTETTQLAIDDAGDVILHAAGKGLVLVSPNGTTYRLSVTNDGEIETTVV